MKSVLISIKPKWCELIASGKKTVEVRKTRPKIETPFKCYIYKTVGGRINSVDMFENSLGKVIGEFVCDNITTYTEKDLFKGMDEIHCSDVEYSSCVDIDSLLSYKGGRKYIYGWHISDLVIYDKPKEIRDFFYPPEKYCEKEMCGGCPKDQVMGLDGDYAFDCEWKRPLKRPPQSWCYVERCESE